MVAITTTAPQLRRRPQPSRLRAVPQPTPRRAGVSWVLAAMAALVVFVSAAYLVQAGPTAAAGELPVLERTHVVAQGETMWSIARDVAPAGEAATYVERLVAANGGASVAPGQTLVLPRP
jgi:LysM repeat protein